MKTENAQQGLLFGGTEPAQSILPEKKRVAYTPSTVIKSIATEPVETTKDETVAELFNALLTTKKPIYAERLRHLGIEQSIIDAYLTENKGEK